MNAKLTLELATARQATADQKASVTLRVESPRTGERFVAPKQEITMSIRRVLASVALAFATLTPVASSAAPVAATAVPCILREHRVVGITPYDVERHQGRAIVQELSGATVLLQAEPGLTAEWLQLTLGRHLAAMQQSGGMKDCAFDVDEVQVKVSSAGAGFAVHLIARDSDKASELLRRAQLLLDSKAAK